MEPEIVHSTFFGLSYLIFGLLVGSFLNVCIYRIPAARKDLGIKENEEKDLETGEPNVTPPSEAPSSLSIFSPSRSFCPKCKNQLKWWHNIPVISWLILGGHCAYCKKGISVRYPFVELLSAGVALLSYLHFGLSPTAFLVYAYCATLIVISFIDYDYYIIPNIISYPGIVIGIIVGLINEFFHYFSDPIAQGIVPSLMGGVAGGGFLLLVAYSYLWLRGREGLGMGDVKLLAMTGAFFGIEGSLCTIFIGSAVGSVFGILAMIFFRKSMAHEIPFGPYLAIGTLVYIFWGTPILVMLQPSMPGVP